MYEMNHSTISLSLFDSSRKKIMTQTRLFNSDRTLHTYTVAQKKANNFSKYLDAIQYEDCYLYQKQTKRNPITKKIQI